MTNSIVTRREFAAGLAASLVLAPLAHANPDAGKGGNKPERGGGGDLSIDMTLQLLPLNVRQLALYYIATMLILTNSSFVYLFCRHGVLRRLENRVNIGFIPLLGGLSRASYSKTDFTAANEMGSAYLHDPTTLILDLRAETPAASGSLSGPGALINVPTGMAQPQPATSIENLRTSSSQISLETRIQEVDRDFARGVGAGFELDRGSRGTNPISSLVTFNDDFSFVSSGRQFYSAFTPFEIAFHNQTRQAVAAARTALMLSEVPGLGQLIGKVHSSDKDKQSLMIVVKPSIIAGYE
jgi:hypothetical protein